MKNPLLDGRLVLVWLSMVALVIAACGGDDETAPAGGQAAGAGTPQATSPAGSPVATGEAMAAGSPVPGEGTPEATPTIPAVYPGAMSLDAVVGGAVDGQVTVTGTAPFEFDLVVAEAAQEYQLYQFKLQWDTSILAYDSQKDLSPEQMSLCAVPTQQEDGTLYSGCGRVRDLTAFVGPVNRFTFHCVSQGTSTIHLMTAQEEPAFGTMLLGYAGVAIATAVNDMVVECAG